MTELTPIDREPASEQEFRNSVLVMLDDIRHGIAATNEALQSLAYIIGEADRDNRENRNYTRSVTVVKS